MALISNVASPASRAGLKNGGSDNRELFLRVFSGEILTAFETNNVMKELQTIRTIQSGKSAQFPVTGIAEAAYHSAGESLIETVSSGTASKYLSDIKKTEKTIFIDDMLIASTFLANIDELLNHYDIRSIYATELGKALAKRFDIACMKTLYAAAKGSANISGDTESGTIIENKDLSDSGKIVDALFAIATELDRNDAPSEGRFAILEPKMYNEILTSDNTAISKDYGAGGNVASGVIASVAGLQLIKSNHLKTIADLGDKSTGSTSSDSTSNNDVFDTGGDGYDGDFSKLVDSNGEYGILAGTKEAIGTVKLLDLATESDYQIERQGTLFVAKYAMGHGVLRPECAVAVEVDS